MTIQPPKHCIRCDGNLFISGDHPDLPDEPCPICNRGEPSGADRVRAAAGFTGRADSISEKLAAAEAKLEEAWVFISTFRDIVQKIAKAREASLAEWKQAAGVEAGLRRELAAENAKLKTAILEWRRVHQTPRSLREDWGVDLVDAAHQKLMDLPGLEDTQ